MTGEIEFQKVALELRQYTSTLENMRGQIFDGSYRQGSLLVFRAMVVCEELKVEFSEEKLSVLVEKVEGISSFVENLINTPTIFGEYLQ